MPETIGISTASKAKPVLTIARQEERPVQVYIIGSPDEQSSWSDPERSADHTADQYFEIISASALIQLECFC